MKVVKCLVTSDQFIIELIIGGGGGKECVSVGDEDIENCLLYTSDAADE